jgi:hypothetical protein
MTPWHASQPALLIFSEARCRRYWQSRTPCVCVCEPPQFTSPITYIKPTFSSFDALFHLNVCQCVGANQRGEHARLRTAEG